MDMNDNRKEVEAKAIEKGRKGKEVEVNSDGKKTGNESY